jgi:hypothetical protein
MPTNVGDERRVAQPGAAPALDPPAEQFHVVGEPLLNEPVPYRTIAVDGNDRPVPRPVETLNQEQYREVAAPYRAVAGQGKANRCRNQRCRGGRRASTRNDCISADSVHPTNFDAPCEEYRLMRASEQREPAVAGRVSLAPGRASPLCAVISSCPGDVARAW